jgi:heme-degrading monooxygenase HmoA
VIVFLFTVVPRDESRRAEHEDMTRRLNDLAAQTPGFINAETYDRPDGGTFGVIRFEDEDALAAWRDHPDHGAAHQRAVEDVYRTYHVEVCELVRDASFTATA